MAHLLSRLHLQSALIGELVTWVWYLKQISLFWFDLQQSTNCNNHQLYVVFACPHLCQHIFIYHRSHFFDLVFSNQTFVTIISRTSCLLVNTFVNTCYSFLTSRVFSLAYYVTAMLHRLLLLVLSVCLTIGTSVGVASSNLRMMTSYFIRWMQRPSSLYTYTSNRMIKGEGISHRSGQWINYIMAQFFLIILPRQCLTIFRTRSSYLNRWMQHTLARRTYTSNRMMKREGIWHQSGWWINYILVGCFLIILPRWKLLLSLTGLQLVSPIHHNCLQVSSNELN